MTKKEAKKPEEEPKSKDKGSAEDEPEPEQIYPTFKPQFNPGEIVYFISDKKEDVKDECLACKGAGKITLHDSEAYDCPKCKGNGYTKRERKLFYVEGFAMVTQWEFKAKLELSSIVEQYDLRVPTNSNDQKKDPEEIDWMNQTGKTSRINVSPLRIRKTYDEAVDAAEEMTEIMEKEALAKIEAERKQKMEEAKEKAKAKELASRLA